MNNAENTSNVGFRFIDGNSAMLFPLSDAATDAF